MSDNMPDEMWAGMNNRGETFWTRHLLDVGKFAKGMNPCKYIKAKPRTVSGESARNALSTLSKACCSLSVSKWPDHWPENEAYETLRQFIEECE